MFDLRSKVIRLAHEKPELRGWKAVAEAIQKMIDSSGPVTVNVRSDEPFENKIHW